MKTVAITAVLGVLVALPFLLGHRKPVHATLAGARETDVNLRYDVDDFLTE